MNSLELLKDRKLPEIGSLTSVDGRQGRLGKKKSKSFKIVLVRRIKEDFLNAELWNQIRDCS